MIKEWLKSDKLQVEAKVPYLLFPSVRFSGISHRGSPKR